MPRKWIVSFLIALLVTSAAGASTVSLYGIGNSLTVDASLNWGLRHAASYHGHTLDAHVHIRSGSSLQTIYENPGDANPGYAGKWGLWDQALPARRWDFVSLQPFNDHFDGGVDAAVAMIDLARANPANSDTTFLIYQNYPRIGRDENGELTGDFRYLFAERPFSGDPTDNSGRTLDFFDEFFDADVRLVPAGEVLLAITDRIEAGTMPGLTSVGDLYRDEVHLSGKGRYAVTATFAATLFGVSPEGGPALAGPYGDGGGPLPLDLREAIQQAAWDVVSTHPNAIVAVPEPSALVAVVAVLACLLRRPMRADTTVLN